MKKLILFSIGCLVVGLSISLFGLDLINDLRLPGFYFAGMAIALVPYFVWLYVSYESANNALGRSASKLMIAVLASGWLAWVLSIATGFQFFLYSYENPIPAFIEPIVALSFLWGFIVLIGVSIFVSRRIVKAEDDTRSDNFFRALLLVIAFFYIYIGMFFIAKRLSKLKAQAVDAL